MSFAAAHLRLLDDNKRIEFLFNPTTLSRERRAVYDSYEGAGQPAPTLEYRGSGSESLSFELLLHAQDGAGATKVNETIEALERLVEPTVEAAGTTRRRPQRVRFVWGKYTTPMCICESVATTIELFEADGTPLRATVAITLTQAAPDPGKRGQNPTTRATRRRRSHLVSTGDTLAGIAFAHYRDPTRWRAIARVNDIDDPLRLPVGSRLAIPLEAR